MSLIWICVRSNIRVESWVQVVLWRMVQNGNWRCWWNTSGSRVSSWISCERMGSWLTMVWVGMWTDVWIGMWMQMVLQWVLEACKWRRLRNAWIS